MEPFSALLAFCARNSPVIGEFPAQEFQEAIFAEIALNSLDKTAQRPVTRSFDVFFDLRLNKQLSKQLWGWWFETPSCPLWL